MARNIPDNFATLIGTVSTALESSCIPVKTTSKIYTIKLVTPLYGGGVEAGENDLSMLIRASSIRGHLRFWWRAIRGAQYETASEMQKKEAEIWGSTSQASLVKIRVVKQPDIRRGFRAQEQNFGFANFGPEAYALFPARDNPHEHNLLKEEGEFQLKVTYPKEWDEKEEFQGKFDTNVEAAIWAWVNFGGIGARTRRGCGALFCEDLAPPDASGINDWFKKACVKYGISTSSSPKEWPLLPLSFYILGNDQNPLNPMKAWNKALAVYKDFRQGVNVARNPGEQANRPGRSRWPEPETIRELAKMRNNRHQPIQPSHPEAFPRAEFGLPIIFHFKDRYEPGDTTLIPALPGTSEKIERMGSPLIVKPLVLQDGKHAVPCVVCLKTKRPERVYLKDSGHDEVSFPVQSEQLQYDKSPLKGRSTRGSAIEGFLNFLTEPQQNFIKVTR